MVHHSYKNGQKVYYTVVGDNTNIMKTTFDLNFDLFQAFKQHGYTKNGNKTVIWKHFSLITCKLVNRKKPVNNKYLNKKVVFIILVLSHTTVVEKKFEKSNNVMLIKGLENYIVENISFFA